VHIFLHKTAESLELSENSLTESLIYAMIKKVHEICNRFIEIMCTDPNGMIDPVGERKHWQGDNKDEAK